VQPVAVRILHPWAGPEVGPLERWLSDARAANAAQLAGRFATAGASDVEVVIGRDGRSFGERLRDLGAELPAGHGLVVAGSGSVPLLTVADARAFVDVAGSGRRRALANNAYSADVLAIGDPGVLRDVPDLSGDNALPRWLTEVARFDVTDLRRRWRLAVDLDSPLDAWLLDPGAAPTELDLRVLADTLAAIRRLAGDRRAELLVAGRTNATTLRWLERTTASRTRALVEERGLRASSPAAADPADPVRARPPRSALGLLLDARGPEAFGEVVAELGDGALVDTRVLLAHRLGPEEAAWPAPGDRFASDLLLPERIADPWLRALTASAARVDVPILLGGHSLVGPGVRIALGGAR